MHKMSKRRNEHLKACDSKSEGLDAINSACLKLYPDQPNPLQVTALVKYWLGGPDPLDYITVYHNEGSNTGNTITPPHWHYVSCGFSDLHGDSRVHKCVTSPQQPSGLGFELSFRLRSETITPPTWPAELFQNLARYVFSSGNILCIGDHISWHAPLDQQQQDSLIRHMLLTPDPRLPPDLISPLGTLQFIQVVGITSEELTAAQKWNGLGILKLMRTSDLCGGEFLITDMKRDKSLFELLPEACGHVDEGVEMEGSLLSGVSALCWWEDGRDGLPSANFTLEPELLQTISLEKVHLKFNIEAARLLPLAIRGRLNHSRHFTFKSFHGDIAITLVSDGVEGAFANEHHPLVAHGPWLQVYLGKEESLRILQDIIELVSHQSTELQSSLPFCFEWNEFHLKITVCS